MARLILDTTAVIAAERANVDINDLVADDDDVAIGPSLGACAADEPRLRG